MSDRIALLSLRPRFAKGLLAGTKTVEVRRRAPSLTPGMVCLLYASSPDRALVGSARIGAVHTAAPRILWRDWGDRTGLQASEFFDYLSDLSSAYVISIRDPVPLEQPIPLAELRHRQASFVVPQSYRFLGQDEWSNLFQTTTPRLVQVPASSGKSRPKRSRGNAGTHLKHYIASEPSDRLGLMGA
jgi:predicted transcriptional regulator